MSCIWSHASDSVSRLSLAVQANFTQLADTREISGGQLSVKHPEP